MTLLIPRVLHEIWLGGNPFPEEFARYRETWREHNPGWRLELWTEDNLPDDLRRPEVHERLRVPAERADILRLEVLWRFGGVYVDTDFECRQPLEPLIQDVDFFTAYLKPGRINNAIIGATQGHPILDRALRELRPVQTYGYDKEAAGPLFLDRLIKDYPETKIFEPPAFYPSTPGERERAVAIHHAARSWKDEEGFRDAAQRARERTRKAREEHARLAREEEALQQKLVLRRRDLDALRAGGRPMQARASLVIRVPRAIAWRTVNAVRVRARRSLRPARRLARRGATSITALVAGLDRTVPVGRKPARSTDGGTVRPIIHQVWLASEQPSREVQRAMRSWRRHNRGWEYRLWTENDLPDGVRRPESRETLRSPSERTQLLRLELLRLYGGVFVDTDLACERRLSETLGRHDLVAATFADGSPDDALLAAPAHLPVVEALLDRFPAATYWGERSATVAELLRDDERVRRLPPGTVGQPGQNLEHAVAVHLTASAPRSVDAKAEALSAEEELAATQRDLEEKRRVLEPLRRELAAADVELDELAPARRFSRLRRS